MAQSPVVLVTGTSTGIGRASVFELQRKGCHVIATARNLDDIKDLAGDGVEVYRLDVTDDASMQHVVDEIMEEHGRIDALVNNAGFGAMLPQEELPMDSLRAMYEVNVFGLHRMTQLVLPHMRAQGSGRIVNVSSVAGHLSLPMLGAYCSTKFAVRALSTALAGELKPLGIKVSIIEPGSIQTNFGARATKETKEVGMDHSASPYARMHRNWSKIRVGTSGAPVRVISKRIAHACTARRPRFRYLAPLDAQAGRFVSKFIPDRLTIGIMAAYFWRGRK